MFDCIFQSVYRNYCWLLQLGQPLPLHSPKGKGPCTFCSSPSASGTIQRRQYPCSFPLRIVASAVVVLLQVYLLVLVIL